MTELMVVLGILAILSAIALPGLFTWIPKYKLGAAARNVKSIIESARMAAVRMNTSVGVRVDAIGNNFTVWIDDGAGGGTADDAQLNGTERVIHFGEMPSGITIVEATQFRFNNAGIPFDTANNPTGGTVKVNNTKNSRYITMTLAGNVSIN